MVTGIGLLSAAASDYDSYVDMLQGGYCRETLVGFDALEIESGGAVPDAELERLAPEQQHARFTRLALGAAREALRDASCDLQRVAPERSLFLLCTTIGPADAVERVNQTPVDRAADPTLACERWAHAPLQAVARAIDFTGEAHAVSHGCSAGNYALSFATDGVHDGTYDVALVGGVDTLSHVTRVLYDRFGILASKSQPFETGRQGLVPAEGCGMMLLEAEPLARRRGARIYAEIAGGGTSADAHNMLAPSPEGEGLHRAITSALQCAGIEPDEVDYISACASGIPLGDRAEALAVGRIFTDGTVPMSATKSQLGHTHGAASVLEAIACVAAVEQGFLPPTVDVEDPTTAVCGFDLVASGARSHAVDVALNNATAFGGTASALLVRRYRLTDER